MFRFRRRDLFCHVPSGIMPPMNEGLPIRELLIIAGRGSYPLTLARSARAQGVEKLAAIGFKGETDASLGDLVDAMKWVRLGQLDPTLAAMRELGIPNAVMAGQIKPTHLFNLRFDTRLLSLLAGLKERNAHSIYGAICEEIRKQGVELLPASRFMESAMPVAGCLTARAPDEREEEDIRLGVHVAKTTSSLEIGQTVVIKEGTILAVEAFEGTDETILRAGKLGGAGGVVVKTAKQGHDMRFDIPVIGLRTMKSLKKAAASVLAVEAGRTILLDREALIEEADRLGISLVVRAMCDQEQE